MPTTWWVVFGASATELVACPRVIAFRPTTNVARLLESIASENPSLKSVAASVIR